MIIPYFQIESYTEERGIICRTRKRRSRSFVQGFLKSHYVVFHAFGASGTITDVDGTGQTLNNSGASDYFSTFTSTSPGRGGAAATYFGRLSTSTTGNKGSKSTNNGIVLGTGTTAVAPTDFQLVTQIADGTSSGQIEHFPSSGGTFGTSGSTASFVLERLFRNSSGGSITVNEVGLYAITGAVFDLSGVAMYHVCMIRDIVSPGFAIGNGEYARVTYTISVTA